MRPLLLTMRAFGPFLHEQTVDFADLDGTFFLIHGPTGAGKTSLLDAMCYALYGRGTGDRDTYRSHHANEASETAVSFTFALGDDVYRAERRLTKKGTAIPKLERQMGPTWELLASKKEREISKRIEELLGFNVDQFRRVVMLPQGQFARFLLAKSDEKETILTTLFGTQRYEAITERLGQLQQEANSQMLASQQGRISLLGSFGAASESELEERLQHLDQERKTLDQSLDENAQLLSTIEIDLEEARETARRFEELTAARNETESLASKEGIHEHEKETLLRSERAASLEEVLRSRNEAGNVQRDAGRLFDEAARRREQAGRNREEKEGRRRVDEEQAPERERLKHEIQSLRALEPELLRMRELTGQLELAKENEERGAALLSSIGEKIQHSNERINEISKEEQHHRDRSTLLPGAKADREKIQRLLRLLQTRENDSREAARLEQRLTERRIFIENRRERLEQKREELRRALENHTRDVIRHLTSTLRAGEACPVCGSREHPLLSDTGEKPAASKNATGREGNPRDGNPRGNSPEDNPPEDIQKAAEDQERELERLREDLRDLELQTLSIQDRIARSESEWRAETRETGAIPSSEEAFKQLQEATHIVETCEESHEILRTLTQVRDKEMAGLREAEQRAVGEREALDRHRERRIRLESEVDGLTQRIPAGLSDATSLLAELSKKEQILRSQEDRSLKIRQDYEEAIREEAAAEASLAATRIHLEEASARFRVGAARFMEALSAADFASEEEFLGCRLEKNRRDELRRSVEGHTRRVEIARERLKKAEAGIEGRKPADVASLEKMRRDLLLRREDQQKGLAVLDEQQKHLRAALRQLSDLEKEQSSRQGRREIYAKLYEAASGRGGRRITLQRYVLACRLEEVLGRASERLRRMTQGRYALRRAVTNSDLRRSAGLDLEIFDSRTGRLRPVASLSGGESFLASLSLALSLAEVVQARTGGIRLDTIFIDEGFGSLDSETLDLAVGTLRRLREGGRTVGIISHVEELKNQLEARIEIRPGPTGSTVHVHSPRGGNI